MQSIKVSPKTLSLIVAASALAVMSVVTLAVDTSANAVGNPGVVADSPSTQSTPPSTPVVKSAAPAVKATKFRGGSWSGM